MLSRAGSFTCALGEGKGVVPVVTDGDDVAITSGPNDTWPVKRSRRKRPALRRSRSPPLLLTAVANDPGCEPPLVVCACPVTHRAAARRTAKVRRSRRRKRCRGIMLHLQIELMGTDGAEGLRFRKDVPKGNSGARAMGRAGKVAASTLCVNLKGG